MYEGRTRGNRVKYTFSDDENEFGSDSTNRRSTRNTRAHTPAEGITTASGRQVRPPRDRFGAEASGSAAGSVQGEVEEPLTADDASVGATGRPRRSAVNHGTNGWAESGKRSRNVVSDDYDDEEGTDFDGDDENDEDEHVPNDSEDEEDDYDDAEAMVEDDLEDRLPRTRIVKIKVSPAALNRVLSITPPLSSPEKEEMRDEIAVEMPDAPAQDTIVSATQNYTPASSAGRHSTPEHHLGKVVALPGTPLAFRGSPEKLAQAQRPPVDIRMQD
jgi:hypothetical protein